ncbi:MAG: VOC family protein [Bradymonadaceae bacterium]
MIEGIHGLLYSDDAEATREFLRDKLDLEARDVGEGWLVFDFDEADLGVHPTAPQDENPPPGAFSVSLYCEEIDDTVERLRERGVTFASEIEDRGWGRAVQIDVPGGIELTIYEPQY